MIPASLLNAIGETVPCETVTPSDITVCIAVRLSDINPWVIERLRLLGENYEPAPRFLILDFGSSGAYASEIRRACEQIRGEYHHIGEGGEFSLSAARNLAFGKVQTDFVFFTDIDFVYERDFYGLLAGICNRFEIRRYPRRALAMPACHVSRSESFLYESLSPVERNRLISQWCLAGPQTEFGTTFEFVAPYSNNFLCHRNLFSMVGGYCTEFVGHGSEDFEFFVRLVLVASPIPLPKQINMDVFAPTRESFFGLKDYAGFRKFLELFCYPFESIGLKSFHLWHPRPAERGYWTKNKDRDRKGFNAIVSQYIDSCEKLLDLDFLPRPAKALCVLGNADQWGYYLPLRLAGYRISIFAADGSNFNDMQRRIENSEFDRIFIFKSDIESSARCQSMVELAQLNKVRVSFMEMGAIPNSICFCEEAFGGTQNDMMGQALENREIDNPENIEAILSCLCEGNAVQEMADTFGITGQHYAKRLELAPQRILIPLRADGGMAATRAADGIIPYAEFIDSLKQLIEGNPATLFFIYQQPLSSRIAELAKGQGNVVICNPSDNIHALIEMCDAVHIYDSSIGVLSVIHGKPVYHCGNVFYAGDGRFSVYVASPVDIMGLLRDGVGPTSSHHERLALLDWLIREKYSFYYKNDFSAEPSLHDALPHKKIFVEQLVLDGKRIPCGLGQSRFPFSWRSYAAGRLLSAPESLLKGSQGSAPLLTQPSDAAKMFSFRRKLKKLFRSPKQFFIDALMKRLRAG